MGLKLIHDTILKDDSNAAVNTYIQVPGARGPYVNFIYKYM